MSPEPQPATQPPAAAQTPSLLLAAKRLAFELDCSESKARQLIDTAIPSIKWCGLRRVRRADLEAIIDGLVARIRSENDDDLSDAPIELRLISQRRASGSPTT